MASRIDRPVTVAMVAILATVGPVAGQDRNVSYTLYGTPGLLEMPSAMSAPDAELAGTVAVLSNQIRTTFTFQITPRLSGSFRYAGIDDYSPGIEGRYYDRSFDLRYRLLDEGTWIPAVAVGLQDFAGTGVFTGEYLVATKTVTDRVRVTAGLGWGQLGTNDGFDNPLSFLGERFETRPRPEAAEGGRPSTDQFFRGDAALFGGVEWAINDQFAVKAEYSSDAYEDPGRLDRGIVPKSQFNYGLSYTPAPGYRLGLSYLYGSELAFTGTVTLNPNNRPFDGGFDPAPVPVAVRAADARAAQTWDRTRLPDPTLRDGLRAALAVEGVRLDSVELGDRQARVRYTNERYRAEAQAMGRVARILTQGLPPSVEVFVLEPMQRGIPLSSVTLRRSDIERLENEVGATEESLARAVLADAGGREGLVRVPDTGDAFAWGISPYAGLTLFRGSDPLQIEAGLELSARYTIQPNLILSGAVRKRVYGNRADTDPIEPDGPDGVPVVRRNVGAYYTQGDPGLQNLTLTHYGRPGADLYSRVTVGYLERMYGGISGEVLWKPVNSRLALGTEINYVQQRDFDLLLGFQDYDVVTGHASAYYAFDNGFHGRIDAGRYLAGDWGATFALDREFENGWRVGAYLTLTDMPFEDFGEGSFDKGIRVTVPTDFIFGQPTRRELNGELSSLTRDGGARLEVDGRLYEEVRGGHRSDLSNSWGRFWR